jgi:hypothetical protein
MRADDGKMNPGILLARQRLEGDGRFCDANAATQCTMITCAEREELVVRKRGRDKGDAKRQAVSESEAGGKRERGEIEEIYEIRVVAEIAVQLDGIGENFCDPIRSAGGGKEEDIELLPDFTGGLGEGLELIPGVESGVIPRTTGWMEAAWVSKNLPMAQRRSATHGPA